MHKFLLCLLLAISLAAGAQVNRIDLATAKFKTGDDVSWSTTSYNDKNWIKIKSNDNWDHQGFAGYDGFAWYRFHFRLNSSLKNASFWKDSLRIFLAKIDDADEIYLNGSLISKNGSFPSDKDGYITTWSRPREIHLSTNDPLLLWDKENLISVRVYDGGGLGGIFSAVPYINMMDLVDAVTMSVEFGKTREEGSAILIHNASGQLVKGTIKATIQTLLGSKMEVVDLLVAPVMIEPGMEQEFNMKNFPDSRIELSASFIEENTRKKIELKKVNPYILTPHPTSSPRINGAAVYGVRPGSPFLYKIAATGKKPLLYSAAGLPDGLTIENATGIIRGEIKTAGETKVLLSVKNDLGESKKELTIRCGSLIALTPPMGWNSWNCWGLSVSEEKLRSSAQALMDKGLADHGWNYMNIDDGWEDSVRGKNGEIVTNSKFPDMKGLGNWLHDRGLKFGIYSSPGTLTCGGYLGSYKHELQDATTYAGWGIDYLKYDWCSYGTVHQQEKDTSLASYMKPYMVMQKALRSQSRDIVYSLCQYGMRDVWKWGNLVDGNSWRTTGDIEDSWESLKGIGFAQNKMSPYAQPGRWNDPDMLIVGEVGWGPRLHPTRLTVDEQYTHISLWCLLSSPLLIGCDISRLDDFTLGLLTNDEMIEINQDPLGNQAKLVLTVGNTQVWAKELSDGSRALGLFNLGENYTGIAVPVKELKIKAPGFSLRDCWRQKELGYFTNYRAMVPPHGVVVLRMK